MAAKPIPTSSATFDGKWGNGPEPDGLGVEGEGKVVNLRFHTVTANDKVERFIAITLEMTVAYKVVLDHYGVEKKLDPKDYEKSDRILSYDALVDVIKVSPGLQSSGESEVHPKASGRFEIWGGAQTDARKLTLDEEIHFQTKGDSHYIKSFYLTKLGSFQGREGGQVMQEMSGIASRTSTMTLEQDEMEGVDSDEWGDDD